MSLVLKNCIRLECSIEFATDDKRQKYCSQTCSAKVNNLGINRHGTRKSKCKNCINILNTRREFCDNICIRKFKIKKWISGEWDGCTKVGLSQMIREHLLEEAKYSCQDGRSGCNGWSGFNPKSKKSCLQIEHIDGNPENHARENLLVMCPNCHSMTETYGALNKGNGRKHRYKKNSLGGIE